MASLFRTRIGTVNLIAISLIAGLTGALSLLSLASVSEMDKIKAHWLIWSLKHIGGLLIVSVVLTTVVLMLNALYQVIRFRKVRIHFLAAILLKSLLASIIAATAGNFILLAD